jgi:hypothetical protein
MKIQVMEIQAQTRAEAPPERAWSRSAASNVKLETVGESRRRVLLAAVVAAFYGMCCWHPDFMGLLGVPNWGIWFLDTRTVLAASDAHAAGLDVLRVNILDYTNSPHVYSTWWFQLDALGLDRDDYVWLGALLSFAFLAVAVCHLRARDTGELILSALLLCAPPLLLGFNRGNADLLIFLILAFTVPCLLSAKAGVRWLGVGVILLCTGLKFYPAVAGVVALTPGRSRREVMLRVAVLLLLLAVIGCTEISSISNYYAEEQADGFFTFGIGSLLQRSGMLLFGGLAISMLIAGSAWWWRHAPQLAVNETDRSDHLRFILGAVLLTGSYLATVSYGYRAVFAIFMLPFLWSCGRQMRAPAEYRWLARAATGLLLFFMWFDGLARCAIAIATGSTSPEWVARLHLIEQPFTLALMATLLAFVLPFARDGLKALLPASAGFSTSPFLAFFPVARDDERP